MSERSRERFSRRRERVPLGANLGLVAGSAFGFALGMQFAAASPYVPFITAILGGLAAGMALGGLSGRFLRSPLSNPKRKPRPDLYDGLPFENIEEAEEKRASQSGE